MLPVTLPAMLPVITAAVVRCVMPFTALIPAVVTVPLVAAVAVPVAAASVAVVGGGAMPSGGRAGRPRQSALVCVAAVPPAAVAVYVSAAVPMALPTSHMPRGLLVIAPAAKRRGQEGKEARQCCMGSVGHCRALRHADLEGWRRSEDGEPWKDDPRPFRLNNTSGALLEH